MIIVDSHCHLDLLSTKLNLDEVIKNSNNSGVKYLQTICTKLHNLDNIISISEQYDNVFASVGIHPNEVEEVVSYEKLLEFASHKKIIGFGETGIDYYYGPKENVSKMQIESLEQHILASCKSNLPVIIHSREAETDTVDVIKSNIRSKYFPFLIHCFSGSRTFASQILDLGGYISISGIVTFKNAEDIREIVKFVPLDRLLLETDSPYLAPSPFRGKINEPAYTVYVAEQVALLKEISIETVSSITTDNFFKLFEKAKKSIEFI